ncbi:helix-turn-helix domain-containing protein [Streptomyces sp. 184]|uniref:helix-turn-helix domain-containing protein n=1 Tax=Streptomyces sp. 184 TaxID=1827526 RepID=UPI0038929C0F
MSAPQKSSCSYCERGFVQREGPGRKRDYCSAACRRRAQRRRSGQSGAVAPTPKRLGLAIAEELPERAAAVLAGEHGGAPLATLLERAEQLRRELDHYIAAAVVDARRSDTTWEQVAAAARVSPATARERWAEAEVERRLRRRQSDRAAEFARAGRLPAPRREPESLAADMAARADTGRATRALAAALRSLRERARLSKLDIAEAMGHSSSYVSRILSGDRSAPWPVVRALVTACDADPAVVRLLWERAHGFVPPSRTSVGEAAGRVHAAVHGLYLAAGCPRAEEVARACGAVTADEVAHALHGTQILDWPQLSALASALGAYPADIRPVWEAFHYASLATLDAPPGAVADGPAAPGRPGA